MRVIPPVRERVFYIMYSGIWAKTGAELFTRAVYSLNFSMTCLG
jgi:hypothetical protein